MVKVINAFALCGLLLTIGACSRKQGPMERAGERVDEVVDNVKEGEPPLKRKGKLEKVGESIDDALDGSHARK